MSSATGRRETIYSESPLKLSKPKKEVNNTLKQLPAEKLENEPSIGSSVSTLALSYSTLGGATDRRQYGNASRSVGAPSGLKKESVHGSKGQSILHAAARDSVYTLSGGDGTHRPSLEVFKTVSIDEPAPAASPDGQRETSWSPKRATGPASVDHGSRKLLDVETREFPASPDAAQVRESESRTSLKRWHHITTALSHEASENLASEGGVDAQEPSQDDSSAELSSVSGSSRENEDGTSCDTVVSSEVTSDGSTENYNGENDEDDTGSHSSSDESSASRHLGVPAQQVGYEKSMDRKSSPSEGSSASNRRLNLLHDHPPYPVDAGRTFMSDLPSLNEDEEEGNHQSVPVKYTPYFFAKSEKQKNTAHAHAMKEGRHGSRPDTAHSQGLGSWKLPPLLKKFVYGDTPKSRPGTAGDPKNIPKSVPNSALENAKDPKKPSSALSTKSYLPIPVSSKAPASNVSKPTSASSIIPGFKSLAIQQGQAGSKSKTTIYESKNAVKATEGIDSSSKTIYESTNDIAKSAPRGTIWDDEDAARELEAINGLSDEECYAAAKIRFESKYKLQKQLGAGGHSTVKLATRAYDGKQVVCKYIKRSSVWHWSESKLTGRQYPMEIDVMRRFSKLNHGMGHSNLIQYYEHFELQGRYFIIMEYLGENWVDLYDYIELYGPVKEDVALEIFRGIVETLVFLHDLGYYHNDIKDENVMIHLKTRQIKLIDFGSATSVPPAGSKEPNLCDNFYGTKKFAAPEAVDGDPYDPEMQESWALGTLLFVLLFKLDPFTSDEEIKTTDIGKRIAKFRALTSKKSKQLPSDADAELTGILGDISDDALEALVRMMDKDPDTRIRVKDILKLPAIRKARRRI